jgi:hypothetical protein
MQEKPVKIKIERKTGECVTNCFCLTFVPEKNEMVLGRTIGRNQPPARVTADGITDAAGSLSK